MRSNDNLDKINQNEIVDTEGNFIHDPYIMRRNRLENLLIIHADMLLCTW